MKPEMFTESFDQFASRVTTTDLALYAGAGIILWILFKDKLSPVQKIIGDLFNKIKTTTSQKVTDQPLSSLTLVAEPIKKTVKEDVFFQLVSSWKQTRDLAVQSGCEEAVKVADEMFPYLSPHDCEKQAVKNEVKS
jgi:hypothetical protein